MKKNLSLLSILICSTLSAQNLLQEDFDNWTEGREPTPGFNNMGDYEENIREYGENPYEQNTLLWKSTPALGNDNNGGFFTAFHPVEHLREYRFSVWFKKTGTSSGRSFMGPYSYNSITSLEGELNNNPIFMNYQFVDLDEWFLAVAYIRPSDHTGTENKGRLYNATGEEIGILRDYKFTDSAVSCFLKALLFYDTTITNNQFLYAPRMEQVNGLEPTIEELLSLGVPKDIIFTYDQAGNQKLRSIPANTLRQSSKVKPASLPLLIETESELSSNNLELLADGPEPLDALNVLDQSISILPNPTDGELFISWDEQFRNLVVDVVATDFSGKAIPVNFIPGSLAAEVNLTSYPSAIYLVGFLLNDGRQIEKKIIKE